MIARAGFTLRRALTLQEHYITKDLHYITRTNEAENL